jgi:hypothetical protein
VLANTHRALSFAALPDADGAHAAALGAPGAKVVLYAPGSETPVAYDGVLKHAPLSKYLRAVAKGEVELGATGTQADAPPPPEEEARPKEEL